MSESVLLGHAPAEMQPSPVSTEGDSDRRTNCWEHYSSTRGTNMIFYLVEKSGGHRSAQFSNRALKIYIRGSGWGVRTLIQSSTSTTTGSDSGWNPSTRGVTNSVTFPLNTSVHYERSDEDEAEDKDEECDINHNIMYCYDHRTSQHHRYLALKCLQSGGQD